MPSSVSYGEIVYESKIADFDIVTHKQQSTWDRMRCSFKKIFLKKKKKTQAKDICIGYQTYLDYY